MQENWPVQTGLFLPAADHTRATNKPSGNEEAATEKPWVKRQNTRPARPKRTLILYH
jgi:hypothetical protein